jgi:hypothetical protein
MLLLASPAAAQAVRPGGESARTAEPFTGVWDLTWRTRKGEVQKGYLVLRQSGSGLTGEVHGQGSLKAAGVADDSAFTLRGRRMGTPFTISGRLERGRLLGSVRVLSVERPFVGARRPE